MCLVFLLNPDILYAKPGLSRPQRFQRSSGQDERTRKEERREEKAENKQHPGAKAQLWTERQAGATFEPGQARLQRSTGPMMMNPFSPNYSKREYLLPNGCKDLVDLLRLPEPNLKELPWPAPPLMGEITLSVPVATKELARVLHKRPFEIVADLMHLGVFTVNGMVPLDAVAKVARRYGYRVMRQA